MEKSLLGKIVRTRRLDLNISQRELASRMQCDVKTISEIEKGIRKKPRIETLEKLSNELYIELEDLLGYAGYTDEELIVYYEGEDILNEEYDEIENNKYQSIKNDENTEVPFNYILTIMGKGLINTNNEREAKRKAAEFFRDALCGTIGSNEDWDDILDNSDKSFVCINIIKENQDEYRRN